MTTGTEPTLQQKNILAALRDTTSNLAIVARAGCGKTFSILMSVDEIVKFDPRAEITVCAFNTAIAKEVKEKLEARGHVNWRQVSASTLHSLGFGLIRFAFKGVKVEDKKIRNIVRSINDPLTAELAPAIIQAVKYAKQEGFGFFDDRQIGDVGAWYQMIDHYGINSFDDTTYTDFVIRQAQWVYRASLNDTQCIDFDDMILFPLIKNMRVKFQKDYLFIDEAQDLSRSRQALARKFIKPSGRVIIVGDDRQAIYGFSGADADALTNLKRQLKAVELPLSITWRCPKAVVRQAQTIVPDIEAAETADEGLVEAMTELPDDLGRETAILCRNTAPLIEMAYQLLARKIPVKVEGREIGEGLINLVNRWKVNTIDKFLDRLEDYRDREIQKAKAKDRDSRVQQIEDKCDTLRLIANECLNNGKTSRADIVAYIEDLFADGADHCTILATYHRSKGREWPRVILLNHDSLCPSRWATKEWELLQEANLAYVAFTRAQNSLYFYG